jgi:hypothetical protein
VRHVVCIGEMKNIYEILFAKPESKSPLGRLSRSWKDDIRMDIRELGWETVDWINLA